MIHLGRSLADFLRKLGIDNDSGGARGYRTRVRDQMDRLFGANVRLTLEGVCDVALDVLVVDLPRGFGRD